MKNLVVLKSFSSGISVIMDATVPFDELLEAVAEKFRSAANFFKDAAVAISLEGRRTTGSGCNYREFTVKSTVPHGAG